MANDRNPSLVVFVGGFIVAMALACGGGSDANPPAKWNCLVLTDGCTCSEPRPGTKPLPGDYVDRCPAADCCLLNTQADQSTLAFCGCVTGAVDCESKALETQTKVVATCPP